MWYFAIASLAWEIQLCNSNMVWVSEPYQCLWLLVAYPQSQVEVSDGFWKSSQVWMHTISTDLIWAEEGRVSEQIKSRPRGFGKLTFELLFYVYYCRHHTFFIKLQINCIHINLSTISWMEPKSRKNWWVFKWLTTLSIRVEPCNRRCAHRPEYFPSPPSTN